MVNVYFTGINIIFLKEFISYYLNIYIMYYMDTMF